MTTRRELLKSAIATATVPIAKEEGEAMEQRQHRHLAASPTLLRRWPGLEAGLRKPGDRLPPGGGMIFALFQRGELAKDENEILTPAFTMMKGDLNAGRSGAP
jgi:hypothetical protein